MRFALIAAVAAVSAFATAAYADGGMKYYLDYSDGFQRPVTLAQLPKDMAGCHAFATSGGNELHCPVSGASQQSAQEQAPPPPRYYQPPPAQYYQPAPQNNSGQVVASFLGALAGAYIGVDRGYYGYGQRYYYGHPAVEYYDGYGMRRNWR